MRAVASLVLLAATTFATATCQHSEGRYLERKVTAAEVTGSWVMTASAAADLQSDVVRYPGPIDPAQHRIELRADGSCTFATLSPTVFSRGKATTKTDVPCRWKLGGSEHQALQIDLTPAAGATPAAGVEYHFDEDPQGRLLLWQYVADPDQWKYVEYARQ